MARMANQSRVSFILMFTGRILVSHCIVLIGADLNGPKILRNSVF